MQIQTFCNKAVVLCGLAVMSMAGSLVAQTNRVGSDYIPGDAAAAVLLSVSSTMASPMAEMYPTEVADAWCQQNIGVMASDINQVKAVVGAPGPGEPMVAAVVTLNADLDVTALNPELVDTRQTLDVDGHSCYPVMGPPGMVLHVKDPRTVVLASQNYLDSVLRAAGAEPTGALAKLAATVPHTGNLTAVVAMEPVRPMINGMLQMQADQIPPPFVEFTRIPDLLDAVLMRVDLEDQVKGLAMVMLARDDAAAEELSGIIDRGLQMGQQIALAQMTSEIEGDDAVAQATRQYMQRLSDHFVVAMTPKRTGRRLVFSGSATSGVATNGVLVALLLPAVQSARQAARRMSSSNNMKMIGLACHNHHDVYRKFPGDIMSADGKPLLSWRVAILPFIEQQALYEQFKLDEPWDSDHNIALLDQMPEVYRHPGMATAPATTVYQRPTGEGFLNPSEEIRFRDIVDGTSNTIMVVETMAEDAVDWTEPTDLQIDPDDPVGSVDDGFREGFNVLLADGAVLFMTTAIDAEIFAAMLTRAGGEIVNLNQ